MSVEIFENTSDDNNVLGITKTRNSATNSFKDSIVIDALDGMIQIKCSEWSDTPDVDDQETTIILEGAALGALKEFFKKEF